MSTSSPLAPSAALRARLGDHAVTDAVLLAALEDISVLARGEAGVTGAAWDPDVAQGFTGYVPPSVKVVVLDAARRRILNPDAFVTEQSGDYGYRRAEGTEGSEHFTDAELRLLRGHRPARQGGLSTIQVTRPGLLGEQAAYVPTTIHGVDSTTIPWSYE